MVVFEPKNQLHCFAKVFIPCKGQLISKGLNCYNTSGRIVFIPFLEELKTPKRHFEINLPLVIKVRQSRNVFFKSTILPKNEQMDSVFLPNSTMIELFRSFLEELEDGKNSFQN